MNTSQTRDQQAKKNILLSFANKGIAIIVSLLFVSATIDFLKVNDYGIWITLSSVVTWAGYFDLGIQHGFRNHLTRAIANNDYKLGKELVSTTYIIISLIFVVVAILFFIINFQFNWSHFLNLNINNKVLQHTFAILIIFFALQSICNLIQTVLTADQKPAYASFIYTIGQIFALISIYVLIYFYKGSEGRIESLAWIMGVVPVAIYIIFSIILFNTRYKIFKPSIKYFNKSLINKITSLGIKFFLIQLSLLLIFQSTSIIITKTLGPQDATVFNIAYRYYGITYMASVIIKTFPMSGTIH